MHRSRLCQRSPANTNRLDRLPRPLPGGSSLASRESFTVPSVNSKCRIQVPTVLLRRCLWTNRGRFVKAWYERRTPCHSCRIGTCSPDRARKRDLRPCHLTWPKRRTQKRNRTAAEVRFACQSHCNEDIEFSRGDTATLCFTSPARKLLTRPDFPPALARYGSRGVRWVNPSALVVHHGVQ